MQELAESEEDVANYAVAAEDDGGIARLQHLAQRRARSPSGKVARAVQPPLYAVLDWLPTTVLQLVGQAKSLPNSLPEAYSNHKKQKNVVWNSHITQTDTDTEKLVCYRNVAPVVVATLTNNPEQLRPALTALIWAVEPALAFP